MSGEVNIRLFQEGDRQDVYRISADTAFFGEPVENFLDDRFLFCDAFTRYYTDFEGDYTWVAAVDDQVLGYLTGCVDTPAQHKRYLRHTITPLVGRVFRGKYQLGRKTWRYAFSMLAGVMRKEYPQVDHKEYPAHLHINVDVSARGQRLGMKLMGAYLDQLSELSIPGVYLDTTDLNEAACGLYERTGFQLLASQPTRVWDYLVPNSIENRVYGLKLTGSE